jgi:phage terminase large subunit-like protein
VTTTPKPKPLVRDCSSDPRRHHRGTTYDNPTTSPPVFFSEVIPKYEGTRLGRQELEAELLLDEGSPTGSSSGVHLVPP